MRSRATCGMAWVSFLSQAWRGHKRGHRLAATSGLAPLHLARACVIRRVKITRPWMRILPEHWPRITGVPLDALLTGGIGQGSRQFVTYRIKCSRTNILSNFTTHKFKTCERQPVNKRTLSTTKNSTRCSPRDPDMIRIVGIRNNGLESPYLAIESLKIG